MIHWRSRKGQGLVRLALSFSNQIHTYLQAPKGKEVGRKIEGMLEGINAQPTSQVGNIFDNMCRNLIILQFIVGGWDLVWIQDHPENFFVTGVVWFHVISKVVGTLWQFSNIEAYVAIVGSTKFIMGLRKVIILASCFLTMCRNNGDINFENAFEF